MGIARRLSSLHVIVTRIVSNICAEEADTRQYSDCMSDGIAEYQQHWFHMVRVTVQLVMLFNHISSHELIT